MKQGGQKQKGNSFENKIAKQLSFWITKGLRQDVLERSPSSGGKATAHRKKGKDFGHIAGDLISTCDEGNLLISNFIIEAKHRAEINITSLIFGNSTKTGFLEWWNYLLTECVSHTKLPMLVVCQNRKPVIICLNNQGIELLKCKQLVKTVFTEHEINIMLFSEFLEKCEADNLKKE